MESNRESIVLTYPHDAHRRLKEDEYLPLNEKVAQIHETCEDRFMISRKGLYDQKEKEGNIVENQMLAYNSDLEKLHRKGHAIISNVRTACEQRQLERRKREKEFEEGILDHMHQKSLELEEKIVNIYERWEKLRFRALQKEEPSQFLKTLKILKNQILEVTQSKDETIKTIKNDLTRINATHRYVLEKQDYDLHYIMQRINNYLKALKQSYVRQILKLDDTINRFHQEEYERLYKCRHEFKTEIIVGKDITDMLENIDKKYEAEREYRASLHIKYRELRTEYDEVTHAFRMHLEKDQEKMEMELEEKTAIYFLNSLKFNYNYQVLDKKNTENANQMVYEGKKKNCVKLVNTASNLRKQIKATRNEFESKSYEIADYCEKMQDRLFKLDVKSKNAIRDNETKFQNILKMNLEEANSLLSQICAYNKIFFEEHLGIRWELPDLKVLVDSNLHSLQRNGEQPLKVCNYVVGNDNEQENRNFNEKENWKMLQNVFEKISGSMGYLMDKDLAAVLELCGLTCKEKKLAQLDNVFSALGFENSESLSKLFQNFQLLAHCSHCEDEKVIEMHDDGNDPTISASSPSPSDETGEMSLFVPNAEKIESASIDLALMRFIEELNNKSNQNGIDPIHQMHLNYAHILSALDITIRSMETNGNDGNGTQEEPVTGNRIDSEQRKKQIELMWNNYRTIFPEEHVHMWSSLESGLADYLKHLKKREKLHMECDRLRRQNAQLKYMLQELLQKD